MSFALLPGHQYILADLIYVYFMYIVFREVFMVVRLVTELLLFRFIPVGSSSYLQYERTLQRGALVFLIEDEKKRARNQQLVKVVVADEEFFVLESEITGSSQPEQLWDIC